MMLNDLACYEMSGAPHESLEARICDSLLQHPLDGPDPELAATAWKVVLNKARDTPLQPGELITPDDFVPLPYVGVEGLYANGRADEGTLRRTLNAHLNRYFSPQGVLIPKLVGDTFRSFERGDVFSAAEVNAGRDELYQDLLVRGKPVKVQAQDATCEVHELLRDRSGELLPVVRITAVRNRPELGATWMSQRFYALPGLKVPAQTASSTAPLAGVDPRPIGTMRRASAEASKADRASGVGARIAQFAGWIATRIHG